MNKDIEDELDKIKLQLKLMQFSIIDLEETLKQHGIKIAPKNNLYEQKLS